MPLRRSSGRVVGDHLPENFVQADGNAPVRIVRLELPQVGIIADVIASPVLLYVLPGQFFSVICSTLAMASSIEILFSRPRPCCRPHRVGNSRQIPRWRGPRRGCEYCRGPVLLCNRKRNKCGRKWPPSRDRKESREARRRNEMVQ